MNLSLIDPFILAQDYPDTLTEKLSMFNDEFLLLAMLIYFRKRSCNMSTVQSHR